MKRIKDLMRKKNNVWSQMFSKGLEKYRIICLAGIPCSMKTAIIKDLFNNLEMLFQREINPEEKMMALFLTTNIVDKPTKAESLQRHVVQLFPYYAIMDITHVIAMVEKQYNRRIKVVVFDDYIHNRDGVVRDGDGYKRVSTEVEEWKILYHFLLKNDITFIFTTNSFSVDSETIAFSSIDYLTDLYLVISSVKHWWLFSHIKLRSLRDRYQAIWPDKKESSIIYRKTKQGFKSSFWLTKLFTWMKKDV